MKERDLLIVGAGPSLFAFTGMRNLSVRLVDSLPEIGGQPKAYILKNIFDIPAYPKNNRSQLSQVLQALIDRFSVTTDIHLNEKSLNIQN